MRYLPALLIIATLLQPAQAEDTAAAIAAPSLGWVYDGQSLATRKISGMLGAAILGPPAHWDLPIELAAIAAQRGFAITVSAEDHSVHLGILGNTAQTRLDGAMTSPERIVFSPSGTAVLLYKSTRLQVFTGLPGKPTLGRDILIDGQTNPVSIAVSDNGNRSLLLFSDRSLWMLDENAALFPMSLQAAAVAYRPQGQEAIAVTASGELYRIAGGGGLSNYATPNYTDTNVGDMGDIAGVQLSPDGTRAYIAYSKGVIAMVDSTGITRTASCACSITALDPVNSPSTFRINDISAAPLLLVRFTDNGPRIWFVPGDRGGL